jgi:MoaA/NifB/PqqE/SkfB family radical SAM enzyme
MVAQSVVRNEDQICCYRSINSAGVRALWEIVRGCNLRCGFCLVPDGGRGLPLERTQQIARELIEAGIKKVLLSGGEPLLYKPIDQIIEYLVNAGALVKLLTNGTVHREAVFKLIERWQQIELSVSLESAQSKVNDAVFGRAGSHARIMALFDRIPAARIHVNVVCSTLNTGELGELLDWAADRGVGSVSLINVFQNPKVEGRFTADCRSYGLSREQQSRVLVLVNRKRIEHSGRLVIRTINFLSGIGCETCGAGRSIIYINAEGSILPCTLTDNTPYEATTRGMTIGEALDWFQQAVPALPESSCSAALGRQARDANRGGMHA